MAYSSIVLECTAATIVYLAVGFAISSTICAGLGVKHGPMQWRHYRALFADRSNYRLLFWLTVGWFPLIIFIMGKNIIRP